MGPAYGQSNNAMTHLSFLLAFGKDAAGTTLAVIFVVGMAAYAIASLIASRTRG